MDQSFFETLLGLARLGSVGVGIAVFLMTFLLLMRGKPVDESSGRLREKFLMYGFLFAVFCGVIAIVPPLIAKAPTGGPVAMRLSFSPDFGTQKLTPPSVVLPDGTLSRFGVPIELRPSATTQVVTVSVDQTLKDVEALRATAAQLATSVSSAQGQIDQLVAAQKTDATPVGAVKAVETSSLQTYAIQQQVSESLKQGHFDQANMLSKRLQASVVTARPSIAVISGK